MSALAVVPDSLLSEKVALGLFKRHLIGAFNGKGTREWFHYRPEIVQFFDALRADSVPADLETTRLIYWLDDPRLPSWVRKRYESGAPNIKEIHDKAMNRYRAAM